MDGWVNESEGKKRSTSMTRKQKQLLFYLERQKIAYIAKRSIFCVSVGNHFGTSSRKTN